MIPRSKEKLKKLNPKKKFVDDDWYVGIFPFDGGKPTSTAFKLETARLSFARKGKR